MGYFALTSSRVYEPDTSDPRQFGPKTLGHYFGGSELSAHLGTGAAVSFGHFGTVALLCS